MRVTFPNKEEDIFLSIDKPDYTILQILWLNNLYNTHALCADVGKCGRCKIEFISNPPAPTKDENTILSQEEIDTGIRLSCKHSAKDEYHIKIFDYPKIKNILKSPIHEDNLSHEKIKNATLAVDFGTTSLEYALIFDSQEKEEIKANTLLNPMQGIGSEIMSRLHFAEDREHALVLKNRICASLQSIIDKHANEFYVEKIVFSANSAMTYLALGLDAKNIACAPYSLDYKGDSRENISYIIDDKEAKLPPVYIPPLLAPFIGGDIASGLLAIEGDTIEYPALFVDMGTNAEFVLMQAKDKAFMASVPLGPSIEGVGLSQGMMAKEEGAVIDFELKPTGLVPKFRPEVQIHEKIAKGMSGTAYIHLLKIMKNIGLIDDDGHFINEPKLPLAQRLAKFSLHGTPKVEYLHVVEDLAISAHDVESILKVKAAFRTSFDILLEKSEIDVNAIKKVYLAGSFAKYVDVASLIELAFLPQVLENKIMQVGNTSLLGAIQLCDNKKQEAMRDKYKYIEHIELANHEDFAKLYMDNFTFKSS